MDSAVGHVINPAINPAVREAHVPFQGDPIEGKSTRKDKDWLAHWHTIWISVGSPAVTQKRHKELADQNEPDMDVASYMGRGCLCVWGANIVRMWGLVGDQTQADCVSGGTDVSVVSVLNVFVC